MAILSLKISIVDSCVVKTMQFDPSMPTFDACHLICQKLADNVQRDPKEFGLFLPHNDSTMGGGFWLEPSRSLDHFLLRNGDILEYKKKTRTLKIRMLDDSVKTINVDDSHPVSQIMITICSKIGIVNHDEYSLVRDLPSDEKDKTMTLKRGDKDKDRDYKKMDEMRKKLHTDDELNWLDHTRTLREQGVEVSETLLFRRKYFFSDQNVDVQDPVQLNLLYVQTRDAILKGAHPVDQEEATVFAGTQCQIQFGDFVESKHRPGFLDTKDFLPKEYAKVNRIEKKIFFEHKKFIGMTEVEAKAEYVRRARSLGTYGITFFLVKEKEVGKNKLVPRLLGITKDDIVRVDEKTKKIMERWPLTSVRKWCATPNAFHLDFGDYKKGNYIGKTDEGEQIAQLVSGYIDIILKRQAAKDHFGIEGNEESAMYEDSVAPARAVILQHQQTHFSHGNTGLVALPGVLRAGERSEEAHVSANPLQATQFAQQGRMAHKGGKLSTSLTAQHHGLGQAQRALLGTISDGFNVIQEVQTGFNKKANPTSFGSDPASQKWIELSREISSQKIGSQLAAIDSATAQIVVMSVVDAEEHDYAGIGSAVQSMCSNLGEFSKDMNHLISLQATESDGLRLQDAARFLTDAVSGLMTIIEPQVVSDEMKLKLYGAAANVGEASRRLVQEVEPGLEFEMAYRKELIGLSKAACSATAKMVLKARNISSTCPDQQDANTIIKAASKLAFTAQQLLTCTQVLAPTIDSFECQEQLGEAIKQVATAIDDTVFTAKEACPDDAVIQDFINCSDDVTSTLETMIRHFKNGAGMTDEINHIDAIRALSDTLACNTDDADDIIHQAKTLAQITADLVNALQADAEGEKDPEQQNKLLNAARMLAGATTNMMESAKSCANTPNDARQQQALKSAAEELRSAANLAATNVLKNQILSNLQQSAKRAASSATQLINTSGVAGKSNTNPSTQTQLSAQCDNVANDVIPRVVEALRGTIKNPENMKALQQLISAAQDMAQPCSKMVSSAKAVVPTVSDQSSSLGLSKAAHAMTFTLANLHKAIERAKETCGSSELDSAVDQLHNLRQELGETKRTAAAGMLRPFPGETAESCAAQLGGSSRAVGSSVAHLLTAASQGNEDYASTAARDTVNALRVFANAARGVTATTPDRGLRDKVIDCAMDVVGKSLNLMEEVKKVLEVPDNPDNNNRLTQAARGVSQALNNCINCLPGLQDIEHATKQVSSLVVKLSQPQKFPTTERHFQEVQVHLNTCAVDLNQATKDILMAASQNSSERLAPASHHFSRAYEDFVNSGMEMASNAQDPAAQSLIVTELRSVSMMASKFLLATKSLVTDPNAPNVKNLLAQAARNVTESINQLINVCTVSAPGQKECDSANRQMQMMLPLLENPNESVIDGTYFDCLDSVIDKSKGLAESMTGITASAKQGELKTFCDHVSNFANTVSGLTESAAQAAYLVGLADPLSEPGCKGIIDQAQFSRAHQMIQSACQTLSNPATTQQQVISTVSLLANNTSALCNICRDASAKTTNPVAKKQFIQSAKELANSTADIVRNVKASGGKPANQSGKAYANEIQPLLQALDVLSNFASSSEFTSTPAKISAQGRIAQEPIIAAGKGIIDGASKMIQAAKQLTANPKDVPTYQLYSAESHKVSDAIKKLVMAIRGAAPGFKECDDAIEEIVISIGALDRATFDAVNHCLAPLKEGSLKTFQEQVISGARQLLNHIDPIRLAAKGETENLGHKVVSAISYLEPLKIGAINCASKALNSNLQVTILDQSKTVIESMQNLILSAKQAGGNRKLTEPHALVDEAANGATEAVNELLQTLEEAASASGFVTALVDNLNQFISTANQVDQAKGDVSFVDCQTNMVRLAKQLARTGQEMMTKAVTNAQDLGPLANALTKNYGALAQECRSAVTASSSNQVGGRIKSSVQQLGASCINLVQTAGQLQCNPTDNFTKTDLTNNAKKVIENVSSVLSALQMGARGTQACINASSAINGIIADLDTTVMFASTGTLDAEAGETFANHREGILKTAKGLVANTKKIVMGAGSSQDELATAAKESVSSITSLAEFIKKGAASLGSHQSEAQVLLINAVKDVASALTDLITKSKNAAGKAANDQTMVTLKESATVMVTNITSLLKTVKAVEDEATRGTQALESSIEVIGQELKTFSIADHVEKTVTPDEIVQVTRRVTEATAKAVAAGNSGCQADIIVAANMGRKAISDLLHCCKGGAAGVEDSQLKMRVMNAGSNCGKVYREMLENVYLIVQQPTKENKVKLVVLSKNVASAVSELVQTAEAMKGSDWVDAGDATAVAEAELLSAANSIEAAARKLASLQPRLRPKQANEDLKFEEQILEACQSIAKASGALVKAASAAQRELVAQGKVGAVTSDSNDDSQWSQGLISAARLVATATHNLCDAANAMVQGQASEERLISSAKQVAASTAQLLIACKVKADPNSVAMNRLQVAGNAVKRATEMLVKEAKKAKNYSEEAATVTVNQRLVSSMAQELMAQEEILRKEKELERAREKLKLIRGNKYRRGGGDDASGSEL